MPYSISFLGKEKKEKSLSLEIFSTKLLLNKREPRKLREQNKKG
jgi:hypothetical protein